MTPYALLLIVAASLLWSGLDWSRKTISADVSAVPFLIALCTGQALLLTPWLLAGGPLTFDPGYWPPALASVALNLAANWLFMRAVAVSPFSLTIPYLALTPMFTALLAIPLLHEVPSALQFAGIALTVTGAWVLNPVAGGGLAALRRERGSAYMVAVALLWSLSGPLDKLAMGHATPGFHGLVLSAGVPLGFLVILAAQRKLHTLAEVGRRPGVLALAVVFGAGGLYLQLTAMQLVLVGFVEAIKRVIGLAMAALVGRLVFKEALTRRKGAALVLMAVGVSLILLKV